MNMTNEFHGDFHTHDGHLPPTRSVALAVVAAAAGVAVVAIVVVVGGVGGGGGVDTLNPDWSALRPSEIL